MDARPPFWRPVSGLIALLLSLVASSAFAASARTQNFMVSAATQELANEIAKAAEGFRRDLAIKWLGKELPNWDQPCPITAQVDPRQGAGGATSFMFGGGRPYGWTMSIQGSRERVLDSVLPHEVTHTIFATHFGRPLPRWADEGACTTVEDASERGKQEKLLYQFLTTNRGIAFNKMFAMKEYPRDILPLYSQGYSLARFLIAIDGERNFVKYVGAGMDSNNWTAATTEFYGFHSLSDLQLSWLDWVRKGTPRITDSGQLLYVSTDASRNGRTLAEVNGKAAAIPENAIAAIGDTDRSSSLAAREGQTTNLSRPRIKADVAQRERPRTDLMVDHEPGTQRLPTTTPFSNSPPANALPGEARPTGDGWYERRRQESNRRGPEATASLPEESRSGFNSSARPQSPEQVKQRILEWRKDEQSLAPAGE